MGQGFESLRARHIMVGVVQRLERQVVALEIVGSNPITHPTFKQWRRLAGQAGRARRGIFRASSPVHTFWGIAKR